MALETKKATKTYPKNESVQLNGTQMALTNASELLNCGKLIILRQVSRSLKCKNSYTLPYPQTVQILAAVSTESNVVARSVIF